MQRIIRSDMEVKSRKICSVPECSTYGNSVISLHKFPLDPNAVKKWKNILKIAKPISKYMFVCSKHFVNDDFFCMTSTTQRKRLKRGSIPSQNLPVQYSKVNKKHKSDRNWLRRKSKGDGMQLEHADQNEQVELEYLSSTSESNISVQSCGKKADLKDVNHPDWVPSLHMENTSESTIKYKSSVDKSEQSNKRKGIKSRNSTSMKQKMPGLRCAVAVCKNRAISVTKKKLNITFHRFPKTEKIRRQWISRCKRKDKFNPDTSCVCSEHFLVDDFEINLRSELMGISSRRTLKKNVIPSVKLCVNKEETQTSSSLKRVKEETKTRSERQELRNRKKLVKELLQFSSINEPTQGLLSDRILRKATYKSTSTKEGDNMTNNNFTALQPQFVDVNSDLQNHKNNQLKKNALPNILRKSSNKELNNKNEVDATDFLETTSNNIEVYIKEEEEEDINIEKHELDYESDESRFEELPQKSLQIIPLNTNLDEMVTKYETKNSELIKENVSLKQIISKLSTENDDIKRSFISVVNEREVLKKENKKLKEQLNLTDKFETSLSSENVVDLTDVNSICRICLQKNIQMKSIHGKMMFGNSQIKPTHFLEALVSIGLDSIELGDHLPNKICSKCNEHLKLFLLFKNTYAKTSQILKLYESGVFKIQNIKATEIVNVSDDHAYAEILYNKENTIKKDYDECSTEIETERPDNNEADKSEKGYFVYRQKLISNKKRAHVCPLCFKELQISDFRAHMREHKGFEKYLSGPKVSKKIKFYALPNNAVSASNDTEKFHNCPFCQKKFKAADFLIHVDNHLKNDQFDCDKCGRIFRKRSYLVQHLLVHTKELPYSCQTCNKGFVNKQNYEFHLLTHSYKEGESPYNCEYCNRKFYNPSHLARHKTLHLENRSYSSKYRMKRCNSCMQSFNSEELLQSHRCVTTNVGLRYCRLCKKSFTTSKTYYYHMRLRHKIIKRKYRQMCTECNKVVTNLTYHKMKVHPDSATKSLCPVCGLYVLNINSHHLKHEPLKCNICNKEFTHSTVLKKHKMIHSNQRPFLCSSCPKAFKCLYNLQVHERIHSGIKRHVCPVCEKGFLEKSYLKKHMKVHKAMSDEELKQEYIDEEVGINEELKLEFFDEETGNEYEMLTD